MIDTRRCWLRARWRWAAGCCRRSAGGSQLSNWNSSASGRLVVVVAVGPCTLVTAGTGTTGTGVVLREGGSGRVSLVDAAGGRAAGLADRQPVGGQRGPLGQRKGGLAAGGVGQPGEHDLVAGQVRQQSAGFQLGGDRRGAGVPADLPHVEAACGGQPGADHDQGGGRGRDPGRRGDGVQQVERPPGGLAARLPAGLRRCWRPGPGCAWARSRPGRRPGAGSGRIWSAARCRESTT